MSTLDGLTTEDLNGIILKLNEEVEAFKSRVVFLEEENERLRTENEELRSRLGGGTSDTKLTTPDWVKSNRAERRKKERKNRGKWFGRRREEPTETMDHALETCPDCGRKLSGGTVHHSRQVVDVPVIPASITEHRVIARYCGVCGKTHMPKLDLAAAGEFRHRFRDYRASDSGVIPPHVQ